MLLGFNTGNSTLYGSISAEVRIATVMQGEVCFIGNATTRSGTQRNAAARNDTQRHAAERSGTHSSLDSASTALRFLGPWMVMMGRTSTCRSTTKGPAEGGTQDTDGRQKKRKQKPH